MPSPLPLFAKAARDTNQNPDLDWLHRYSPYNWAFGNQPLLNGVHWGAVGLLSAIGVLLVALAAVGLNRRDLSV